MARRYKRINYEDLRSRELSTSLRMSLYATGGILCLVASPFFLTINPFFLFLLGLLPIAAYVMTTKLLVKNILIEGERIDEEKLRADGKKVIGMPPQRDCITDEIEKARSKGKKMIDKYLIGFEVDTGKPLWINDEDICSHGCVFAKTGGGKTLWLESLIFQQMARGRASGCTFIDAKRDTSTLAHIVLMALVTGRIEDLVVIDPFDPIHAYNFVMTNQRPDVKARKVLRAGLPPTSDQSVTKHYDRLAADSIYRMVRALESLGLSWSMKDIAVALSSFQYSYPHLKSLLQRIGARNALVELGYLASSYRNVKGTLDTGKITENLRGIASELSAISGSVMGKVFCTNYTDVVLTDAILRGKIIYFMLPRLEEAESANRMVKVFREDLEVSIGEITSSRIHNLEDPHLVIIDEGASTFGPTWANLFELARKGRFALIFGAQSTGGLTDKNSGLSQEFYERVMANVNLKVIMRVGDNKTAADMSEWIGKVTSARRTVGTKGLHGKKIKGDVSLDSITEDSSSVSFIEGEQHLVSSEELKHEMSDEKGLAWFDMGSGKIIKGRSFWVDAEIPAGWSGREYIVNYEKVENDEIGLAEWVDDKILKYETEFSDLNRSDSEGKNKETKNSKGRQFQHTSYGNASNGLSHRSGDSTRTGDILSDKNDLKQQPFKVMTPAGSSQGNIAYGRRSTISSFIKTPISHTNKMIARSAVTSKDPKDNE
jgi:hypothetical protein